MKAALIPNLTRDRAYEITVAVAEKLRGVGIESTVSEENAAVFASCPAIQIQPKTDFLPQCDFVISVGGDGSMIHAAKLAAFHHKKILGVNAGHLAYLCGVDADEMDLLERLVSGGYSVENRMLLRVDELDGRDELQSTSYCMNDMVVSRGSDLSLVNIEVYADRLHVADYLSDGIIVATPTGSTAYSLAAGGPIADPSMEAMIVTPICPHQLNLRPYLFRAETVLTVQAGKTKRDSSLYISSDGEPSSLLQPERYLRITKAEFCAEFIKLKPIHFVEVLNKKIEFNR